MGVPQHRRSKARIRRRRAAQKLDAIVFGACPQCHEPKMPHRVCPACGFYREREVIKKEVEVAK